MDSIIVLAIIVISAYIFQIFLGMKQLKHFNQVYAELRQKGRVTIGRRSGRIRSGTIVMFAINSEGIVLDARKMQGISVLATFKAMPQFLGQDIHYVDSYNPLVRKENRLLQIAIEDARELFLRVEAGSYQEISRYSSAFDFDLHMKTLMTRLKYQFKK
ncbi:glucitol operon activator protein [Streptococcus dysgalactiae subsp. dysgalactiae]|uniref:Glucitol operon activator protein n=1 Tax=Streptococcus dysgalactiae subsp. dysgalactiae TaxID=99822 RepID=A0A380JYN6_STRDY|nr:transcriptional regulator GutM [Streptococcus dysgalactiae]MCB2831316.1 transcriptional regulator GutM [Streptococcus dysgalactiae subsp. dysgalactiae]MCB2834357.1 transcriptional regulator GutM [Streptococcus dysgalactiae subsp. dysgalactiae]MCB2837015.1 transcriptional regulator GutM [Streptococcus dysgalactiae subsp. dysgalactiae]MCB2840163.1 transcriptional regulator GutM [Streptococcus dysgalactiae subsp. dysgalactiae]MCB2848180.1 transcriptional regulator GutM [Streptococcus dysgalact